MKKLKQEKELHRIFTDWNYTKSCKQTVLKYFVEIIGKTLVLETDWNDSK